MRPFLQSALLLSSCPSYIIELKCLTPCHQRPPILHLHDSDIPGAFTEASDLSRLRGPISFHENVQVVDLLPESIPIQTQQFCRLDLVTLGLLKRSRDQGTFNRADQKWMQVSSGTMSQPFHKFSHFPFKIVLKG